MQTLIAENSSKINKIYVVIAIRHSRIGFAHTNYTLFRLRAHNECIDSKKSRSISTSSSPSCQWNLHSTQIANSHGFPPMCGIGCTDCAALETNEKEKNRWSTLANGVLATTDSLLFIGFLMQMFVYFHSTDSSTNVHTAKNNKLRLHCLSEHSLTRPFICFQYIFSVVFPFDFCFFVFFFPFVASFLCGFVMRCL